MFEFFLKIFIGLLSFLPTKLMSLNNEHCKTRPFLIDLNHIDRKYLFTITLD